MTSYRTRMAQARRAHREAARWDREAADAVEAERQRVSDAAQGAAEQRRQADDAAPCDIASLAPGDRIVETRHA